MLTVKKGTGALFFIQLFSTLSYSVLYSALVLFSVEALHLSVFRANNMLATFIAFNFALHLLGGFLGGRLLSFRNLFLMGLLLQTLGAFFISMINMHTLYFGMALFTAGAGLNVPCINCMLTQLFDPEDKRRENAFLWNYSGMNIGFLIGYTIAGYYQLSHNYHLLFLLSSFSNIVALFVVFLNWQKLKDVKTYLTEKSAQKILRGMVGLGIIITCIIVLCFVLEHAQLSAKLVMFLGGFITSMIFILACFREKRDERNKMFAYLIFAMATLVFFTLYQLCPMALTLFLERNVDRNCFGFKIPTEWFLNIDTIIIIFGCPLFAHFLNQLRKNGCQVSMPLLFSLGLIFIGIAISIIPLGIYFSNTQGFTAFSWLIFSYTLLALGELLLSPMGYALVGQLAPLKLRGLLMGSWLMISGVAATLSGYFSNKAIGSTDSVSPMLSNPSYSHTFLLLGLISIFFGLVLFIIKPYVSKLMHST